MPASERTCTARPRITPFLMTTKAESGMISTSFSARSRSTSKLFAPPSR